MPAATVSVPGHEDATLRPPARRVRTAVVAVLPAWIVSRAIVLAALVVAHLSVSGLRPHNTAAAQRVHQGLLSWDAGWYQSIAAHGYAASGLQSVRFFPGFPMVARALAWLPGISVGAALLIVANLAALGALTALFVLVAGDLGDPALARRSVWLLALAPSAYSLVMGYADSSLLLLAVLCVLALRRGRWWWAAGAGLAAGLVRPVGALLIVPAIIEAWRATARSGVRLARPGGGRGSPRWSGRGATSPGWAPSSVTHCCPCASSSSRGTGARSPLPLSSMWHNADSVVHGHHLGSALHIPWVVLTLVLLVLAYRRLPLSYAGFATAVLAVSLTCSNLDSFERYALGAFPLVIAASTLTTRRSVEVTVLAVSAAAMAAYALGLHRGRGALTTLGTRQPCGTDTGMDTKRHGQNGMDKTAWTKRTETSVRHAPLVVRPARRGSHYPHRAKWLLQDPTQVGRRF